jgi:hypothetical protein
MIPLPGDKEREERIQRNMTIITCLIGVVVLTIIYFMH